MAMVTATALRPRLSFSHDVDLCLDNPSTTTSSPDDFDFSVNLDNISISDHSPADHLFSHGILLPLNATPTTTQPQSPEHPINTHNNTNTSSSPPPTTKSSSSSFWNIGRSSSVGAGMQKLHSICPFPRSKSTGSYTSKSQSQNQNQNQNQKQKQKKQQKTSNTSISAIKSTSKSQIGYYYYGSGKKNNNCDENGVRISPVINVPAHFIPRGGSTGSSTGGGGGGGGAGNNLNSSVFAYLLCNCGVKDQKELVGGGEI